MLRKVDEPWASRTQHPFWSIPRLIHHVLHTNFFFTGVRLIGVTEAGVAADGVLRQTDTLVMAGAIYL